MVYGKKVVGVVTMRVSQKIVAILGGASQQAVSQSGNARRWLSAKVRQRLFPEFFGGTPSDDIGKSLKGKGTNLEALVKERAYALLAEATEKLQSLPEGKPGGRPVDRSPEELGKLLGVCVKDGEKLYEVFARYLKGALKALYPLLGRKLWVDLWETLDKAWFPVWVHAEPVYESELENLIGGLDFS